MEELCGGADGGSDKSGAAEDENTVKVDEEELMQHVAENIIEKRPPAGRDNDLKSAGP